MISFGSRLLTIIHQNINSIRVDSRGKILAAIAIGWGLSMGSRMIYPVLLPHLRVEYGLDLSTAGLLLTVLFLGYALGQLPGGFLADAIGEGRTLGASMLISAGMIVLVAVFRSTLILFTATALLGFSLALFAVARYTALSDIYTHQFGTASGITSSAAEIGRFTSRRSEIVAL